jgi:CubicO group peptidase (beta-lactamase class C family)
MTTLKRTIVIVLSGILLIGNIRCQKQEAANLSTSASDSSTLPVKLLVIEKAIEAARVAENVPGAAVVIVKDDSVILLKGFGFRDVEAKLPVIPRTLFAIGSCTKTFTAVAAAISTDQGKLSLDDSPKKFLPYFELRDPEANVKVTLRDLLSHRTGVPDDLEAGWFERFPTCEELIRFAMQSKPAARFRKAFQYNNYMYLAAGEAIGRAHDASYEDVIARLIFAPLGMSRSNLSITVMQEAAEFSYGYDDDRKKMPLQSLAYLAGTAPAGGINSNAEDMAQWLRLLLGGGMIDGKRLVSEKGFQELLTEHVKTQGGHYGLGLFIEEWRGHRLYFHAGGVTGFGSRFEVLPDQKLGLAVLTNFDDQKLPKKIREIVYANLVARR